MKLRLTHLAAALGVAFLLSAGGGALAQDTVELKLAHGATTDQAIGKGMEKFAELVAEKSGGAVTVQPYLAGSL